MNPVETNVNGTLFFAAHGGNGARLWKSDGTASGTVLVKDIYARGITNVNGTVFFSGDDGTHGIELWDPPPVASQVTSDESRVLPQFRVWVRTRGSAVASSTLPSSEAVDVMSSAPHAHRRHKHREGLDRDAAVFADRGEVIDDAVAFGVRHLMRDHSDSELSARDLMGTRLLHITLPDDLLHDLCTLERL